jgi:hypothetical protein
MSGESDGVVTVFCIPAFEELSGSVSCFLQDDSNNRIIIVLVRSKANLFIFDFFQSMVEYEAFALAGIIKIIGYVTCTFYHADDSTNEVRCGGLC